MAYADISFVHGTIGLTIPFVLRENGVPISNAVSANVTWIASDGQQRALTLETPISAVFTYLVSAQDWPSPRQETGYLRVSFGTNVFFTVSAFTVHVVRPS